MRVWVLAFIALCLAACSKPPVVPVKITGEPKVWHVQTLSFEGPMVKEERSTFTDYSLDVIFFHQDGDVFEVPGYFAGIGNSEFEDFTEGNIWEAKFVPNKSGEWKYELFFSSTKGSALYNQYSNADNMIIVEGEFNISSERALKNGEDFRHHGILQDVNERYLQFSGSKKYWLKTGAGSPENIFAYADFDGTYDTGGTLFPSLGENQLHEFEPHVKDWREGDPIWGDGKGKGLIGLMNYYAEVGVNSQYMVMMNYKGDGQDVFPYVDPTDPYVFDVSKLAQWQIVFDYMDTKGIAKNFLFLETENESYFGVVDGVEVGKDFAESRKLYYREMVARFGHSLGLLWNLGEEQGVVGNSGEDPYRQPTSVEQRRQFAQYIREIDPYNHAIVSHNWPDGEKNHYTDLLGEKAFSGISLQAHYDYFYKISRWHYPSEKAGRPWVIMVDEPLGWEYGAKPDIEVEDRRDEIVEVLWATFMAGGSGVDWYFGWQNNAPTSDLSNEDQRTRHNLWVASSKVREFWESNIPYWQMNPMTEKTERMHVFSKSGNQIAPHNTRLYRVIDPAFMSPDFEILHSGIFFEKVDENRDIIFRREIDPMNPQ